MRPSDEARYQAALLQLKQGNVGAASEALASLALRYESNPEIRMNLAMAYYLAAEPDRAEEVLTIGDDLSRLPHYHNLRGLLAVQRGDYQSAEQHYRQALELDAEHAQSHYNLALLYDMFYQDLAAARPHYLRYLELIDGNDGETTAWLRQIESALARGDGG